jgi:type II secretory pathway pseudopilin PulG
MMMRNNQKGFTFLEIIIIIIIVGVLGALVIVKYISFTKDAEKGAFDSVLGSLRSGLNLYSVNQIVNNQTITAHNPFDDLANKPPNYVGFFPDVDTSNCPAGCWAYQSGASGNGNWAVLCYRPQSTLKQAYVWQNVQWIALEVTPMTDPSSGKNIGLSLLYSTLITQPIW